MVIPIKASTDLAPVQPRPAGIGGELERPEQPDGKIDAFTQVEGPGHSAAPDRCSRTQAREAARGEYRCLNRARQAIFCLVVSI
jgi:hypothetical protein